ncbi:minor extracellular protease Epr [Lachnospiraceae bacterium]|nr:minor extracellular protease Epr [Lachnospiraceae bacterium]
MKIAIIDSGINLEYNDFKHSKFEIIDFIKTKETDICGHGTSCCGEIVNWKNNADFLILKVLDGNNRASLDILYQALNYCLCRDDVYIINISCSWNTIDQEINYMCFDLIQKLNESGKIVVSSFENDREEKYTSYPAAFVNTWGVRHKYSKIDKIEYDLERKNCIFYGSYKLMPHKNGEYKFFRGNSAFSARLSGILYYYLEDLRCCEIFKVFEDYNKRDIHDLQKGERKFFTKQDLYECLLNVNYEKYKKVFEQHEGDIATFIIEKECLQILRMIERKKGIKIKYTEFSCEDFCNINKMIEMINKYGKK